MTAVVIALTFGFIVGIGLGVGSGGGGTTHYKTKLWVIHNIKHVELLNSERGWGLKMSPKMHKFFLKQNDLFPIYFVNIFRN